MDLLTIVGMLFGICTIIFGQFLEGGNLITLLNIPALIIVLGGTCGAVMIETQWRVFLKSLVILPWIFMPPPVDFDGYQKKLMAWSTLAKRKGILSLENALAEETNTFIKNGLTLLIDKGDAKVLRNVLTSEYERKLNHELEAAQVFESMGGYAPTIGIIGAVIGLIQVMGNLTEPSKLGIGIAVAFVATIYGVGFANLFFLPVANKLKKTIFRYMQVYEMILEGLVAIAEGESLHILEQKLLGYTK